MGVFKEFPKKVMINDVSYKIHVTDRPGNSSRYAGVIWYDSHIEVEKTLNKADRESTLIHEMLHAISRHYGMRLSETTILKLEEGIFNVFKHNDWKITI